jgi:hypothetical protein
MPRPVKAKKKPSEKGVVGDIYAALSCDALNEIPSPNQRKNPRRATLTYNVARTKTRVLQLHLPAQRIPKTRVL